MAAAGGRERWGTCPSRWWAWRAARCPRLNHQPHTHRVGTLSSPTALLARRAQPAPDGKGGLGGGKGRGRCPSEGRAGPTVWVQPPRQGHPAASVPRSSQLAGPLMGSDPLPHGSRALCKLCLQPTPLSSSPSPPPRLPTAQPRVAANSLSNPEGVQPAGKCAHHSLGLGPPPPQPQSPESSWPPPSSSPLTQPALPGAPETVGQSWLRGLHTLHVWGGRGLQGTRELCLNWKVVLGLRVGNGRDGEGEPENGSRSKVSMRAIGEAPESEAHGHVETYAHSPRRGGPRQGR